jgi:signal peptide peptidase SppA
METILWLGSQANYSKAESAISEIAKLASSPLVEKGTLYEGFQVVGNVAIVDISGSLVNSDSPWNRFMGLTSYNEVRNSLISAAAHPDVMGIVINADSTGGTPNGITDAVDVVSELSKQIPVYTYSGSTMCSAMYWLGSAARKVFVGATATVGSIGVISVHLDYSEQLKSDGIIPTVFRAGAKKALLNVYEPATEEVKASVDSQMEKMYDTFVSGVAKNRGVSKEIVLSRMADGQEFIGSDAVKAGLADGMGTLNSVVNTLQREINSNSETKGKGMSGKRKLLTENDVALLSEGIEVEAVENSPAKELEAAPEAIPKEDEIKADSSDIVNFLTSQLKDKDDALFDAKIKLVEAEAKLASISASHSEFRAIVEQRIGNLQIPMGGVKTDMSSLSDTALLAQHSQLQAAFNAKFPVGGLTIQPKPEEPKTKSFSQEKLNAVRGTK